MAPTKNVSADITLCFSDPLFVAIGQLLKKQITSPHNYELFGIRQFYAKSYLTFAARREVLRHEDMTFGDVKYLWHGSSEDGIKDILTHGFLREFNTGKARFGKGSYFQKNVQYCLNDSYTKRFDHDDDTGATDSNGKLKKLPFQCKRLLLCRVLTGCSTQGRSELVLHKAGVRPNKKFYHSMYGNSDYACTYTEPKYTEGTADIYVLGTGTDSQVYPEFEVTLAVNPQ